MEAQDCAGRGFMDVSHCVNEIVSSVRSWRFNKAPKAGVSTGVLPGASHGMFYPAPGTGTFLPLCREAQLGSTAGSPFLHNHPHLHQAQSSSCKAVPIIWQNLPINRPPEDIKRPRN